MLRSEFYYPAKKRFLSWRKLVIIVLMALSAWQFGQGAWIHAKAIVAQLLIAKSWQETLATEQAVPPWPWADTWPIARLSIPAHGKPIYALAGSSDAIIAFGPGHLVQSAYPGQPGNSVFVGHRDTHFAILESVQESDLIEVETSHGTTLYRINSVRIAHESQAWAVENTLDATLTLITCYPFDSLLADTDLRYIVTAIKVE
ncbi:class GN sortase [Planctobacterium marinum]|uniref:Class GN sortase n=1 Tax=Planctobacterium marinum TaxID=1631968 RepID=A0AA48HWM3_9ALTE|nr:hypothetical protein MACH26_14560 [Planctobacterium marinum]